MRSGKQNAFTLKPTEMADIIINQIISMNDGFGTAENNIHGVNKGKILLQPMKFGME